jgi:hypothetical protein
VYIIEYVKEPFVSLIKGLALLLLREYMRRYSWLFYSGLKANLKNPKNIYLKELICIRASLYKVYIYI